MHTGCTMGAHRVHGKCSMGAFREPSSPAKLVHLTHTDGEVSATIVPSKSAECGECTASAH